MHRLKRGSSKKKLESKQCPRPRRAPLKCIFCSYCWFWSAPSLQWCIDASDCRLHLCLISLPSSAATACMLCLAVLEVGSSTSLPLLHSIWVGRLDGSSLALAAFIKRWIGWRKYWPSHLRERYSNTHLVVVVKIWLLLFNNQRNQNSCQMSLSAT